MAATINKLETIEDLAAFCKSRGFVFPNSEIYGSFAGFWDYGPTGVELKNKIKANWWKFFVQDREDVVGVDGAILSHPKIWEASGHATCFSDVAVICKKCGYKSKADKCELGKIKCPKCKGEYKNEGEFNLMFATNVGPIASDSIKAYLRPETAQMIFANFKNVVDSTRVKIPFGIAQIGKAFRNEIAPRDFIYRCREFEQMELQYFIDSDFDKKLGAQKFNIVCANGKEAKLTLAEMLKKGLLKKKWHAYWLLESYNWFINLGIKKENLRLREHNKDELSHYAKAAIDIEYNFNGTWKEICGSHDRAQFDISQHEKFSKLDLKIFDEKKGKILPAVIESSFGADRAFLVTMFDAYNVEKVKDEERIVLKLKPALAPVQIAVFPLVKKDGIDKIARKIYDSLKNKYATFYDEKGSIGKRYRRMDEIGTSYAVTVDYESLKKDDITLRDRDSMKQIRIKIKDLQNTLYKLYTNESEFDKLGKLVK